MAQEEFIYQLERAFRKLKQNEGVNLAPFSAGHKGSNVKKDCNYLVLVNKKNMNWSGPFGTRFPFCRHPEMVEAYRDDQRLIISCLDCPLYLRSH